MMYFWFDPCHGRRLLALSEESENEGDTAVTPLSARSSAAGRYSTARGAKTDSSRHCGSEGSWAPPASRLPCVPLAGAAVARELDPAAACCVAPPGAGAWEPARGWKLPRRPQSPPWDLGFGRHGRAEGEGPVLSRLGHGLARDSCHVPHGSWQTARPVPPRGVGVGSPSS